MKPKLSDRLLMISLVLVLILAFWCLSRSYAYHHSLITSVF
jgi:hypothetical protein